MEVAQPKSLGLRRGNLAHPQFWAKPRARWGGRFLWTPRRCFLPGAGGLQPRFCGNPSPPPSFAERSRGSRKNPFPPGFLIHRPPRRAILARENWGWTSSQIPLTLHFLPSTLTVPKSQFLSNPESAYQEACICRGAHGGGAPGQSSAGALHGEGDGPLSETRAER